MAAGDITLRNAGAGTGNVKLGFVDHALAGSFAGAGALAAELTVDARLSGAFAGTGALSGAVIAGRKLSGAFGGTGSLAGILRANYTLRGAIAGLGELDGILARNLAGFFEYLGEVYLGAEQRYAGIVVELEKYQGWVEESGYRGIIDPTGEDGMFSMIAGDLSPSFEAVLKNAATDEVVDLSDASGVEVKFKMGRNGAVSTETATIVSAEDGTVRYDWQAGDTDEAGTMFLRFVVAFSAGPQTFPSDGEWYEFEISE